MKKASFNSHFEYFQYLLSQLKNPTSAEVTKLWESFVRGSVPKTHVGLSIGGMKKEKLTPQDIANGVTASYIKTQTDKQRGPYTVRYQIKEDKLSKVKTFVIQQYTPSDSLDQNQKTLQHIEKPYTLTINADDKAINSRPRVYREGLEVVAVPPVVKVKGVPPAQTSDPQPTQDPQSESDGKKTKKTKKKKVDKCQKAHDPNIAKLIGWGIAIAVAVVVIAVGIWHGIKYIPPTQDQVKIVGTYYGDSAIPSNHPNMDHEDSSYTTVDKDKTGENQEDFDAPAKREDQDSSESGNTSDKTQVGKDGGTTTDSTKDNSGKQVGENEPDINTPNDGFGGQGGQEDDGQGFGAPTK